MLAMRTDLLQSGVETLVVVTPHGAAYTGEMTLADSELAFGALDGHSVRARMDSAFSKAWGSEAHRRGLTFAHVESSDGASPFSLDWGVTIPLLLLDPKSTLPITVACPGHGLARDVLIGFGEALAAASNTSGKKVALIASADQGHGHAADGPYGYAPESAEYDLAMQRAIEADDLSQLLTWEESWIDKALADSYLQTLILYGAQKASGLRGTFIAYEVDHYFGLLCATYQL